MIPLRDAGGVCPSHTCKNRSSLPSHVCHFSLLHRLPLPVFISLPSPTTKEKAMPPKKAGRPRKYLTDEARRAAHAAASRRSYAQLQQGAPGPSSARRSPILDIRPDPYSLLLQTGPEGVGQFTLPSHGIQADGLVVPTDPQAEVIDIRLEGYLVLLTL